MAEAKEFALALCKALDSKKGKKINCLETGPLTSLADYFVICTATSTTQVRALADECEKCCDETGGELNHREGYGAGANEWVLLDFNDVVVHIFLEEARKFYDLDRMWSDAKPVDLSGVLMPN